MRKLFARVGGKNSSAKTIISYLPDHETYVEPFAGGASIYFSKEPSSKEVLADTDTQLIQAYKDVKKLNPTTTNTWDYTGDKETFNRLKKSTPSSPSQRFYRYAYVNLNSFGGINDNFNPTRQGKKSNKYSKMEEYQERMKQTTIKHQGYEATIKQYDSPTTVFYLDPPYYQTSRESYRGMKEDFDWDKFASVVKSIKGKFLLSSNPDPYVKKLFKGYKIRNITTLRGIKQDTQAGGMKPHREILITNF